MIPHNATTPGLFFNHQLEHWPQAAQAYKDLEQVKMRNVDMGDCGNVRIMFNPARIRSTAAKVDSNSIAARKCFLCASNRPQMQQVFPGLLDIGYEFLLNPFPILNPHFTIASIDHTPQHLPVKDMEEACRRFPQLVFFFNGASSGASAPDHLHFQAVSRDALPLISQVEKKYTMEQPVWNSELGILHPAPFLVTRHPANAYKNDQMLNAFVWSTISGEIRWMLFPRSRHRAAGYPEPMVSPGALDVAGIIVTVRAQDYETLDAAQLRQIFSETTCKNFL